MQKRILTIVCCIITSMGIIAACHENEEEVLIQHRKNTKQTESAKKPNQHSRTDNLFDANTGSPIETEEALRMIRNYQEQHTDGVQAHTFGVNVLKKLINQRGLMAVSMYYGLNDEGIPQLLLIGVDENGRLMKGENEVGFVDFSKPCPPCFSDDIEP